MQQKEPKEHYVCPVWDISEVLDKCMREMTGQEKLAFFNTPKKDLIHYHHGFGTWIRNTFGLWLKHPELPASMCLPPDIHPDDLSFKIILALWARVRD